jgi:YgiT-type zinc finger domain-containing protein
MNDELTTHVTELKNCIVIIKNVPCLKCKQCGEVVYSGEVLKELDHIIDTLETNMTEIAVVNYPNRVA